MIKFLKDEWCILSIVTTLFVCSLITDGLVSVSYLLIEMLFVLNWFRDSDMKTAKIIDVRNKAVQSTIDYIRKEISDEKLH